MSAPSADSTRIADSTSSADAVPSADAPPTADRTARALRASARATFAFALFELWALPAPLHRNAGNGAWVVESATILQVAITVALAVFLRRGSRAAGALTGLYGAWRMGWALVAVVSVPAGTWQRFGEPTWVIGQLIVLPFAVFWVRGGLAVLREWRQGRAARAVA